MSQKLIQAWKNEDFRFSLTDEERGQIPENPAGVVELTDELLDSLIHGGRARELNDSCGFASCNG